MFLYLPPHACMDQIDEGTRSGFIAFLSLLLPTLDKNKTWATDYRYLFFSLQTLKLQKKRILKGALKSRMRGYSLPPANRAALSAWSSNRKRS